MSRANKPKPIPKMPTTQSSAEVSILRYPDETMEVRYFATASERDRSKHGTRIKFPHIRPHSVCVFAIGSTWEPTAWQKIMDMVWHTNKKGVCCWLTEIRDNCVQLPYAALCTMKDAACMWAHDQGFEYIMLVDNDILPEPDLVLRLLNWDMPIVVPYITDTKVIEKKDEKTGEITKETIKPPIANPGYKPNEGLKPIIWAALSCILISCKVLNCFPECAPFGNVNIESGFYNKLMHYGHKVFQDTNTELKIATRPTFPADNKTIGEMMRFWKRADVKRRGKPDRKPIDPEDKRDIYLPKEWKIQATTSEEDLKAMKQTGMMKEEITDLVAGNVKVPKIGRNQPCPCNSGKKYKNCCGA